MPSLAVKLYSVLFKFHLNRRLQTLAESINNQANSSDCASYGVVSRPGENIAASNPSFAEDGVATKDLHIDPLTSLSLRIFLPDSVVNKDLSFMKNGDLGKLEKNGGFVKNGDLGKFEKNGGFGEKGGLGKLEKNGVFLKNGDLGRSEKSGGYGGYLPENNWRGCKKLPVILQFHGGGWVSGGNDTVGNDGFCRRLAKLCDAMVVSVGYRLAPESRYPAAFEDGVKALNWLRKQANLAECSTSYGMGWIGGGEGGKRRQIVDGFGAEVVEPWLAAHADLSRCVLLGVSCGANIANFVARNAVQAGKLLDPVRVVAQVLMYPFFIGSIPTRSEIKLANSYLYDKTMSMMAWKLFLPEDNFTLDHPAANPLLMERDVPLKNMPPTLTVIAEHDWMRDRAIAYSEELRKVNVDAPHLDYKDTVHDFATLEMLLKTPQAQACSEDIAIWVKKYISLRGHEFSY
ncbi:hypothetical protein Leryth_018070 [Lithospermum erythrorhizon]|nr:hypothetical protein Leryth_018070 [Lithospermum erythrorhizon]